MENRNQTILYTDNLTLDLSTSIPTVSNDGGNTTYPLPPMDKHIDDRARAKRNSNSQENLEQKEKSPPNNTSALSLAQLKQNSR